MTEDELRTFLEERQAPEQHLRNILSGLSLPAARQQALQRGFVPSDAFLEESLAKVRAEIAAKVLLYEDKPIPWEYFLPS